MEFSPSYNNPGHSVQSVEETARQIGIHTQDLCMNHRLTIENAKVGEYIKPETNLSFACYKHGPKPLLINSFNQYDEIIKIIKSNPGEKIGILVYYNEQVHDIRDYFLNNGIPVEWKSCDGMEIDFKSSNPVVLTFHCAKGLQFSDVFIPHCERFCRDYEKSALYVATTRPELQLYLIYTVQLSTFLPPSSSDIYSNIQLVNGPF